MPDSLPNWKAPRWPNGLGPEGVGPRPFTCRKAPHLRPTPTLYDHAKAKLTYGYDAACALRRHFTSQERAKGSFPAIQRDIGANRFRGYDRVPINSPT